MADVKSNINSAVAKGEKKKKVAAVTKKPTHPPTSQMVNSAVKDLKEKGGSSLQAIKKYIATTYKVDADKMGIFIRKYIKSAVQSGQLVQTKGKGAAGSFKLGGNENNSKKVMKSVNKAAIAKKKKAGSIKVKKTKKPPTTPKAPKPKSASGAKTARKGKSMKKTEGNKKK